MNVLYIALSLLSPEVWVAHSLPSLGEATAASGGEVPSHPVPSAQGSRGGSALPQGRLLTAGRGWGGVASAATVLNLRMCARSIPLTIPDFVFS